jgi:hypothetical protein
MWRARRFVPDSLMYSQQTVRFTSYIVECPVEAGLGPGPACCSLCKHVSDSQGVVLAVVCLQTLNVQQTVPVRDCSIAS